MARKTTPFTNNNIFLSFLPIQEGNWIVERKLFGLRIGILFGDLLQTIIYSLFHMIFVSPMRAFYKQLYISLFHTIFLPFQNGNWIGERKLFGSLSQASQLRNKQYYVSLFLVIFLQFRMEIGSGRENELDCELAVLINNNIFSLPYDILAFSEWKLDRGEKTIRIAYARFLQRSKKQLYISLFHTIFSTIRNGNLIGERK
jgi:hypothetical protein